MKTIADIFRLMVSVKKNGLPSVLKITADGWEFSNERAKVSGKDAESLKDFIKMVDKAHEECSFDDEPKPKGRPLDADKRKHIIELALCNETLSMSAIARHVGCSETLVANVFKDSQKWDKRENWRT
jgi:DNA invertase Pin-like site-specific DNA recombinase